MSSRRLFGNHETRGVDDRGLRHLVDSGKYYVRARGTIGDPAWDGYATFRGKLVASIYRTSIPT